MSEHGEEFNGLDGARRRQKLKMLGWIGLIAFGGAIVWWIWVAVFRTEKLPFACDAAVVKVQEVCGISRKKAISRIKAGKHLVDDDKNWRETCRVLASPDHQYWRRRAILLFAKEYAKQAGTKTEVHGTKGKDVEMKLPHRIKAHGLLSQESVPFVDQLLVRPFIKKTYCP